MSQDTFPDGLVPRQDDPDGSKEAFLKNMISWNSYECRSHLHGVVALTRDVMLTSQFRHPSSACITGPPKKLSRLTWDQGWLGIDAKRQALAWKQCHPKFSCHEHQRDAFCQFESRFASDTVGTLPQRVQSQSKNVGKLRLIETDRADSCYTALILKSRSSPHKSHTCEIERVSCRIAPNHGEACPFARF